MDPLVIFCVVFFGVLDRLRAVDRGRGQGGDARSVAMTNDLEADEDPPDTWPPGNRQRRCGSSHLLPSGAEMWDGRRIARAGNEGAVA